MDDESAGPVQPEPELVDVDVVVVKTVVASCADDNPNLTSSSPGILATRNTRFLHHYRALRTLSLSQQQSLSNKALTQLVQ